MTTNLTEIADLVDEVNAKVAVFVTDGGDEMFQKELLEAARNLVRTLESPFEVLARMSWLEPFKWSVTRIGLDIGLFKAMASDDGSPKSLDQLAGATKCDPVLLSRFLKHLNASGFVKQIGPSEYATNRITMALSARMLAGMVKNVYLPLPLYKMYYDTLTQESYDIANHVNAKLPEFFRNTSYQNPTNKDATAFKYGMGTDLHYFEWLIQPGMDSKLDDMKAHIEFKTLGKKWFQSVDVEQIFDQAKDPRETLMVDIGGSAGHDVIDFHKTFPEIPGKLVLQELPAMIMELPADFPKNIEAQVHDMFTPQPIKGANTYYLHMILHDWPDESCRKVLSNIVPAMRRGYSKILLNEIVIADMNADWFSTSVDMLMLVTHSAQERTERGWREFVESVGLTVTKIWDCDGNPEKIIEIELA